MEREKRPPEELSHLSELNKDILSFIFNPRFEQEYPNVVGFLETVYVARSVLRNKGTMEKASPKFLKQAESVLQMCGACLEDEAIDRVFPNLPQDKELLSVIDRIRENLFPKP